MAISTEQSNIAVTTTKAITGVGIGRRPDGTIYWDAPVSTKITRDSDGATLNESNESFQIDQTVFAARFTQQTFNTAGQMLTYILATLEAEYTAQQE